MKFLKLLLQAIYSYKKKNYEKAYQYYIKSIFYGGNYINYFYLKKIIKNKDKCKKNVRIAVSGWELAHNAAGRVITLAELYYYAGYKNVEIIGCIIQNKANKKTIWRPIISHFIPYKYFEIQNVDSGKLIEKAINFVIENPFDIVHLSKSRITNIVIGALYKIIWDAKVIVDIDDEELAFLGSNDISDKRLKSLFWTKISVPLSFHFDGITTSNPILQDKYGGKIIPHVRNEKLFKPSNRLRKENRSKYHINDESIVILFFGTPKKHKGLLETAKAIQNLKDSNIIFLIVGDFFDSSLKKELEIIEGVNYIFLPDQPYEEAKNIVSIGDICILLQNNDCEISNYQLPAKLIDALAMGLTIFAQKTPAISSLIDKIYINYVSNIELACYIKKYILNLNKGQSRINFNQHTYFVKFFSIGAYTDIVQELVNSPYKENSYLDIKLISNLKRLSILDFLERYQDSKE